MESLSIYLVTCVTTFVGIWFSVWIISLLREMKWIREDIGQIRRDIRDIKEIVKYGKTLVK